MSTSRCGAGPVPAQCGCSARIRTIGDCCWSGCTPRTSPASPTSRPAGSSRVSTVEFLRQLAQCQARLDRIRKATGGPQYFMRMTQALGGAITGLQGVTIEALSFHEQAMDLKVTATNVESLSSLTQRWTVELAALPRSAPIPRRLVEQAIGLGADLAVDRSVPDRLVHTDLHYANVLAADRENWLAIDPKPVNGDPHYEIAPLLWNRWGEIAGAARAGVRRRFQVLVDAGEFDEDRARAWVLVRMAVNAMWELQEGRPDPASLTRCVTVAKAVGD